MFHRHKPEIVAVEHGMLTPVGGTSTTALYRCRCGYLKTESFRGRWTVEQLRGEAAESAELPERSDSSWRVFNA
jgi:hypothetical protein